MKAIAAEGRTVFVSSHLMSEMENTADHLLVIGRGRMIADCTVQEFIDQSSEPAIRVRTPEATRLATLLATIGATAVPDGDTAFLVTGLGMDGIGDLAFDNRADLHRTHRRRTESLAHLATLHRPPRPCRTRFSSHRRVGLRPHRHAVNPHVNLSVNHVYRPIGAPRR